MVKRKPRPLAPPPMRSRKKARKITTKFHKLTAEKEKLLRSSLSSDPTIHEEIQKIEQEIELIGGRKAYQEASQLSTSMFSTSKWIIKQLGKLDILSGKVTENDEGPGRRLTKVLEIGAINTELLNASNKPGRRLSVRAIDLRSSYPQIEQLDFLTCTPGKTLYDVIVNSMVLNCVPVPRDRGKMLRSMHAHLVPGGFCFVMIPLRCLMQSRFINKSIFLELLKWVGFEIYEEKQTPKIFFLTLRKETEEKSCVKGEKSKWQKVEIVRSGKKFQNTFSVTFEE